MNVLFCSTNGFLPQSVGGVECSTHETCTHFRAQGLSPVVLAALKARGWLTIALRVRRHLLRDAYPVDLRFGYPVFRVWDPVHAMAEIIRRSKIDVVLVNQNHRGLVQAGLDAGVPTVLYAHGTDFVDLPSPERPDYISNSCFTAARLKARYGVASAVIPPLILPERYRVESHRRAVLFVNPHPAKGVEIALGLARARPDIPFIFVESWPLKPQMRAHYRAQAARCPNIRWQAPVADMRRLYREARLVLVPSLCDEAWGRVASEAQVSGIPVLASRRGGLPESVGPGGVLVDPQHGVEAWVEGLSRMWDDPLMYDTLSAKARMHSLRDAIQPARIFSDLQAVLSRAVRHASPGAHRLQRAEGGQAPGFQPRSQGLE